MTQSPKKRVRNVPVIAMNLTEFKRGMENMLDNEKPKTIIRHQTEYTFGGNRYFYASSVETVKGMQFKSFISFGAAFLHPNYKEIMDEVLMISQRDKYLEHKGE